MPEWIKRRLIHFETDGLSIVSDFVSVRQKRAAALRRVIHACFYIQCAAAAACVVLGFAMGGAVTGLVLTAGAAAVCAAALMAVAGDIMIRTISYVLNMVYAVICFITGGTLMSICGALMLIASAAALAGFAAGHFREYLLGFSPLKLTPQDYTLTGEPPAPPIPEPEPEPLPPPRSELMLIADQVADILRRPRPTDAPGAPDAQTEIHDES